jgi:3-deoxy-7-phosphoheptulonate synthase
VIVRFVRGVHEELVQELVQRISREGLRVVRSPDEGRAILAVVGKVPKSLAAELAGSAVVEECLDPRGEWLLVQRAFREQPSTVTIGRGAQAVRIGAGEVVVIAGPCSVEGREAVLEVARAVKSAGAHILRGGAFKPRTSPYAFQGFGVEGLRQLKDAGDAVGMPVISEIMDAADLPAFLEHGIDCLQVGARNMQNFTLLKAIAGSGVPVLLKRGLAATVDEWLAAAEYLAAGGARGIALCERGIRTFERATRNTLDLTVLPLMREWTHLPILVDPAHAAGIARIIPPLARASIAAGADGVAVEVHLDPRVARSDADQALLPGELAGIVAEARIMAAVTGRRLHASPGGPGAETGAGAASLESRRAQVR